MNKRDDGYRRSRLLRSDNLPGSSRYDDIDRATHEIGDEAANHSIITCRKSPIENDVLAVYITEFAHLLQERMKVGRLSGTCSDRDEANNWNRLPARHNRPHRRAAEQRDELAPLHSITSSARASSVGGISRLSALAVLRLMTSSNLIGCWTGSSAGFAPLRILPT